MLRVISNPGGFIRPPGKCATVLTSMTSLIDLSKVRRCLESASFSPARMCQMDKPIYKIFLNRYRDAWYQLSDEERTNLMDRADKDFQELGIKTVVLCDTSWDTEEWDFAGVAEYPDIEAVLQLRKRQDEVGWFRYFDAKAVLGTKLDIP